MQEKYVCIRTISENQRDNIFYIISSPYIFSFFNFSNLITVSRSNQIKVPKALYTYYSSLQASNVIDRSQPISSACTNGATPNKAAAIGLQSSLSLSL